jgi:hypothetical protein
VGKKLGQDWKQHTFGRYDATNNRWLPTQSSPRKDNSKPSTPNKVKSKSTEKVTNDHESESEGNRVDPEESQDANPGEGMDDDEAGEDYARTK